MLEFDDGGSDDIIADVIVIAIVDIDNGLVDVGAVAV